MKVIRNKRHQMLKITEINFQRRNERDIGKDEEIVV